MIAAPDRGSDLPLCTDVVPNPADAGPGLLSCLFYARPYPCGWRCYRHSPAARAGRPEPPPGPGWPADAWTTPLPAGASALIDDRAVASGKRRSTEHIYRAAQAAEQQRRDRQ